MGVRPGKIIVIPNKERKFGSSKQYILLYTTEHTPLMFTEQEVEEAHERALNNKEDLAEYPINNNAYFLVLILMAIMAIVIACVLIAVSAQKKTALWKQGGNTHNEFISLARSYADVVGHEFQKQI